MNREEFFASYGDVEARLREAEANSGRLKEEYGRAREETDSLRMASEVLNGLQSKLEDPGKDRTAYFFVSRIRRDKQGYATDIVMSNDVGLMENGRPVIGSYEQTYDSPDGDTWSKQAFVLEEDGSMRKIASVSRGHRFL